MTCYKVLLGIIACLVLSLVCPRGVLSATSPQIPERTDPGEVERLLEYYAGLRGLSVEALQYERRQREMAFAHSRSHEDRLRLICVLSAADTSAADTTQALTLLQEYFQDPGTLSVPMQTLAMLLWQVLNGREQLAMYVELNKKLQETLTQQEKHLATQQQLQQKLLEDLSHQKTLNTAVQKQLHDAVNAKERQRLLQRQLHKKLQDEKKNVRKLQEKIEKIQDIEKSLIERERTDNKGT